MRGNPSQNFPFRAGILANLFINAAQVFRIILVFPDIAETTLAMGILWILRYVFENNLIFMITQRNTSISTPVKGSI